ncbi:MAG: hypothetical protein K2J42_00345 [Muribaculaceae bacterium]|nr:hypothetical protein [Muribaculaceae bacterium]
MDLKTLREYKKMMEAHRAGLANKQTRVVSHKTASKDKVETPACRQSLLDEVKADILTFLKSWPDLLRNEIDFQIHLGSFLLTSPNRYERVFFEYRIPNSWVSSDYVWDSNLRIDIVVYKNGEYLPVELKYPTALVRRSIECFDEDLNPDKDPLEPILKHQGATDLVCYNFWKDVRRLEVLKKKFKKVKSGLAVLVTNDRKYIDHDGADTCSLEFCISKNIQSKGPGTLSWRGDVSVAKTRPAIDLDGHYPISWQSTDIDGVQFNYLILEIK